MADSWMPDVQVDIAFTSTFATPAASRTWTDVSAYVELHDGIDITVGRQDERSTADANQISLTLDNTDGRFTAGRAASPYFPNVKIGRPIRVRVTPPGGSTVTRFVGFIDEWPVEWDGTDRYASATIRATSRMSRLGLTAKMRSMVEQEILADNPSAYYTLGDSSGSVSAVDSSGNAATGLRVVGDVPALSFGSATGLGSDGLTAATFAGSLGGGGQYLGGDSLGAAASAQSMGCFVRRSGFPPIAETVLSWTLDGPPNSRGFRIEITTLGMVNVRDGEAGGSVLLSGTNVVDGSYHHVGVVRSGATWTLYVDGVAVDTTAGGAATAWSLAPFVGGPSRGAVSATVLNGSVAHAAFWQGVALSGARMSAHASAGRTGYAGERTDQRIVRILGWAGVASSEITTETGQQTMTYQKTSGQSVVDAMRDAEATESGVLYDRADGNIGFQNRAHRYLSSPAATLNMAAQHVGSDYMPKLDRSTLVNDVTVSNPTSEQSARATDASSSNEYGGATATASIVADTYDALQQKANWLIASYSTPRTRVPSLTVDVLAHQGLTPSAQTLLGVTVGDLLAVTNAPTQADSTSQSYFVEGYTETIGPESYEISFNLSPTFPHLNTFVLDSATRGVLDSTYVLAL